MECRNLRVVLAHGAGSDAGFLRDTFPAAALGVAEVQCVDNRTGRLIDVMNAMAACAPPDRPTVLGGVSLGAHAAARLLARPDLPPHVVGGLLIMPAWSGGPDRVADLTATAAAALAALGPAGVLAELDPHDWVTPQLRRSWALRSDPADLVAELTTAAGEPGPTDAELAAIRVPVALVALADDPLHPQAVARRWESLIPVAGLAVAPRSGPADALAAAAVAAAAQLTAQRGSSEPPA